MTLFILSRSLPFDYETLQWLIWYQLSDQILDRSFVSDPNSAPFCIPDRVINVQYRRCRNSHARIHSPRRTCICYFRYVLGQSFSPSQPQWSCSSLIFHEITESPSLTLMDETETKLVNLRRAIYLTIMSSIDFEEAGHKLLEMKLEPGQEMELCIMLLECCSQERSYLRHYGLLLAEPVYDKQGSSGEL